ncbi:MAG: hypothetical protein JWO66_1383 [Candidatus Eremiobacteraeota bacterium]|nr:hypothetical protein [Candidatus Eremiobacteraeota bacterium]
MNQSATGISVQRSIAVEAPQARAFDVFVNMTSWWPLDTHTIGEAPARASIVEPHAGGRWYGIDKNGDEHGIGHVLAYEPPDRLVLTWEISHDWQYDPSLKTEVEVRFFPESPTRTRVELEHRGLEAYGERAEAQRELYEGDQAWSYLMQLYAKAAASSPASG